MKATMTVGEAVAALWEVAKTKRIAGEALGTHRDLNLGAVPDQNTGGGFILNWERGWGASARLGVRTDVKDGNVVVGVDVCWPSVNQAPMAARCATALHAEVADLACWMQSLCDAFPPLKS